MYRQFRLSTHRKNEFRWRRTTSPESGLPQASTVAESDLLVSIRRDNVSVLPVSIPLRLLHGIRLQSTEQLRSRINFNQ